MIEYPANQAAMAATLKNFYKGRAKPLSKHLETAEQYMADLRERGFRLVPFPPLKSKANGKNKRTKRKARAKKQ